MICGECADLDEQGEISTLPRCHDGMCAELLRQEEPTPGRHFTDKRTIIYYSLLSLLNVCTIRSIRMLCLCLMYSLFIIKILCLYVHQNASLSLSSSVHTLSLFVFGLSLLFLLSSIHFLLSLSLTAAVR